MTLDIYLNKESVPNGRKVILDNDSFFNKNVNYLENNEMEIIKPIDNFVYLGNNKIETPYGVCSIYDLSTGSKTIINVMRNPNLVFDITGCGNNALNILFPLLVNYDYSVILEHYEYRQKDLEIDNKLIFKIDDSNIVKGSRELIINLMNVDE